MEKRIRVLLIGNPASIHVFNYVKNVLCYEGYDITIFNYNGVNVGVRDDYSAFYTNHNVKLIEGYKPVDFWKWGYRKYVKKTERLLESLGQFDVLHEHYVKDYIAPVIYQLRYLYGRIVLTYYGSDLYRTNIVRRFLTLPSLFAAHRITLISDDMMDSFKSALLFNRFSKKCSVVDFGNMFYDRINSLDNKKEDCKKSLGFEPNTLLITVGYVGRPQMQQYETIEALTNDNRFPYKKVQFAIPAYGMSNDDYDKIQKLAQNRGMSIMLFRDFMGEEEVSKLRVATDIFIHAQTTDALSCAMLEHLFAGSIVVNGAWLRYGTLAKNKVYYRSFDSFRTLSDELLAVINNINEGYCKASYNRDIISHISSWESLRPFWLQQYA